MSDKFKILVIDDEEAMRDSCSQVLMREGHAVKTADDGEEGLDLFSKIDFDAVLLDLKLPRIDGMEVLSKIKKQSPQTPVIIITGYATIESTVNSIKNGAFDYLAKPFSSKELRVSINKALRSRNQHDERIIIRKAMEDNSTFSMVVGKSKSMERVLDIVKRVGPTESTVLITGDSGTGKELLATEIHRHSPRRNTPFVVVDCGALVETLFESELFGHVKGSFTGAYITKHGRFEVADGGTIFLDEISNISLNIQAKLLRAIQEREITRIGSSEPIKVDVRILAATNVDLADHVREGKFREDLFYRLSVVPLNIPPLRERKDDIPLLIEYFLKKYSRKSGQKIKRFSPLVIKAMREYDWPGNIRELENTVERAIVLSRGEYIEPEDIIYHGISSNINFLHPTGGKYLTLEEIEREYIKSVLQAQLGNKSKTAKILKIDRKTLSSKVKKYKLD